MAEPILGFNYEINDDKELEININPVSPMRVPIFLFKYLPLNKFTINCLKGSYFYLSTPVNFNDPFDCWRELIGERLEVEHYDLLFANIGIISMTDKGRDILMWAHYCDNEGITLKFKTEYLRSIMNGLFFMNYQRKLPDLSKYDTEIRFATALNIKSLKWKYEREWRLIKKKSTMMKSNNSIYADEEKGHKLLEREQKFDIKQLYEVTIGFKFFIKENITKIGNKLNLKTIQPLKIELLDYLIQENIYTQIIDFGNPTEFKLKKVECKIEKKDFGEYEILFI